MDLSAQVADLTAKVAELQGRLAQNSRNYSRPPSSDGLHKPQLKSLRTCGEKSTGGHRGHARHTLKRMTQPDRALPCRPLGQALAYTLGQWPLLTTFHDDGHLEIDNNSAENVIRPVIGQNASGAPRCTRPRQQPTRPKSIRSQ